jgi:hypothetical protein
MDPHVSSAGRESTSEMEIKRLKTEEADKMRRQEIEDLRHRAELQRGEQKRETILRSEEDSKRQAEDRLDRDTGVIDIELDRKISHLKSDARKKENLALAEEARKKAAAEDKWKHARADAESERQGSEVEARKIKDIAKAQKKVQDARMNENRRRMDLDREKKRAYVQAEDQRTEDLLAIKNELTRLVEESQRQARQRSGLAEKQSQQRQREAEDKARNALDWTE